MMASVSRRPGRDAPLTQSQKALYVRGRLRRGDQLASVPYALETQAALLEDGLQFSQRLLHLRGGHVQRPGQLPHRHRLVGHEQQGLHQYGQMWSFGHRDGG
jgi:hypothetical protein